MGVMFPILIEIYAWGETKDAMPTVATFPVMESKFWSGRLSSPMGQRDFGVSSVVGFGSKPTVGQAL